MRKPASLPHWHQAHRIALFARKASNNATFCMSCEFSTHVGRRRHHSKKTLQKRRQSSWTDATEPDVRTAQQRDPTSHHETNANHDHSGSSSAGQKRQTGPARSQVVSEVTLPLLEKLEQLGIIKNRQSASQEALRTSTPEKSPSSHTLDSQAHQPNENSFFSSSHEVDLLSYINTGRKGQVKVATKSHPAASSKHTISEWDESTTSQDDVWLTNHQDNFFQSDSHHSNANVADDWTEPTTTPPNTQSIPHSHGSLHSDVLPTHSAVLPTEAELPHPADLSKLTNFPSSDYLIPQHAVKGYSLDVESDDLDNFGYNISLFASSRTAKPTHLLASQNQSSPHIRRPPTEISYLFRVNHPQAEEIYEANIQHMPRLLAENSELQWNRFLYHSDSEAHWYNIKQWIDALRKNYEVVAFATVFPNMPRAAQMEICKLVLYNHIYLVHWLKRSNIDMLTILAMLTDAVNLQTNGTTRFASLYDARGTIKSVLDGTGDIVFHEEAEVLELVTESDLFSILSQLKPDTLLSALTFVEKLQTVELSYSFHTRLLRSLPRLYALTLFESHYQFRNATFAMYRNMIRAAFESGNDSLAWRFYNDLQKESFSWSRVNGIEEIIWQLEHKYKGDSFTEILMPYMKGMPGTDTMVKMLKFLLQRMKDGNNEDALEAFHILNAKIEQNIERCARSSELLSLRTECLLLVDLEAALTLFEDNSLWSYRPHALYCAMIEAFIDDYQVVARLFSKWTKGGRVIDQIPLQYYNLGVQRVIISLIYDGRNEQAMEMLQSQYRTMSDASGSLELTRDILSMFIAAFTSGPRNSEMIVKLLRREEARMVQAEQEAMEAENAPRFGTKKKKREHVTEQV